MITKLSVAPASVVSRPLTEAQREARVMKIIRSLGVWHYKVADKFTKGIPDRYLAGGNWIEFKQEHVSGNRDFCLQRGVSAAQRTFLKTAHAQGDRTYLCVFVIREDEVPVMILVPFWYADKRQMWTPDMVRRWGVPYKSVEMVDYLDKVFGSGYARNSSRDFYVDPARGME